MRRRVTIVLLVLAAGVVAWLMATKRGPAQAPQPVSESASVPAEQGVAETIPMEADSNDPILHNPDVEPQRTQVPGPVLPRPKPVSLAAAEELPAQLEEPQAGSLPAPVTALENMRTMVRQYTLRFGENPVGTNPEITATLNGRNSRQVVFLQPDDGMRINQRGELVDNWGTPYFFHQLSRTEMEIQSAGPDRRMWTSDDLVIK